MAIQKGTFAEACESDMNEWGITKEQWYEQIEEAIKELKDDAE